MGLFIRSIIFMMQRLGVKSKRIHPNCESEELPCQELNHFTFQNASFEAHDAISCQDLLASYTMLCYSSNEFLSTAHGNDAFLI